ncbi:regulatory helix-turn-helix LysR family protein [Edaphobacter modestus]|uniref:Regulatory helix-turn-helix LysR family protein n=2 Tax=Edaphobacter modestus TaxID=388466 RepID=A0A4Q7Z249_9BACT|nr:LysR family transcriptional regulator [Edaphobacter modestus]RZU43599.1 regulatory helix-turn-helix LysR family protein [Edaphobacter modestus]
MPHRIEQCARCRTKTRYGRTRAAELEGISQPSLSQQIRKLEQTVGAPLFTRLGRRTKLTAAGETLYEHARKILRHQPRCLPTCATGAGRYTTRVIE